MKTFNKRARFDYKLEGDRFETGLVLSGGEAKAVRTGHTDLSQSVARVLNGEVWLINANIPVLGAKNYNSTRSRKLLLHKFEILSIATKMKQRKLTLVPLSLYNKGRLIKLKLALGKPKRKFEKRQAIKAKDIEREIAKELSSK
jgi:SsrA-binding protein